MDQAWNTVVEFVERFGIPEALFVQLLWTLGAVAGFVLLRGLLRYLIGRRIGDIGKRYVVNKTVGYALGLMMLLALVNVWLGGLAQLATYLGILSAGVAIALQSPLSNLAGWLYIVIRKPFNVGDRVQVEDMAGDVIDISLFQFTVVEIGQWVKADQSTGRICHLPNGWVFEKEICNYTQGFNFVWEELPVTVTFESNWEKAKEILLGIAREHNAVRTEHAAQQIRRAAQKYMIFFEHLTPIVWTSVADCGVTLTIRYLTEPRRRRSSSTRMWEHILREFAACDDVDFAYPTTRFYDNAREGKQGARPSHAKALPPTNDAE